MNMPYDLLDFRPPHVSLGHAVHTLLPTESGRNLRFKLVRTDTGAKQATDAEKKLLDRLILLL